MTTSLLKPLFLTLLTVLVGSIVACLVDSGFIYWQATRGRKLPFKVNVIPRFGLE